MELNRVERSIWRFNGIVIAAAGVMAIIVMVFVSYKIAREVFGRRSVSSVVNVVQERTHRESLSLSRFSRIQGSSLVAAQLEAEQEFQSSYYSKAGSSSRNYLFFDTSSKTSHWLLPTNSSLILTNHEILEDTSKVNREERKIVALLYEVVSKDTNADGRLDFNDKKSLTLYRVSDGRVGTVLDNFDMFLGLTQSSWSDLTIFFRDNEKVFFAHIDVTLGTLAEKTELATNLSPGK
jgi:hypothetical protein